MFRISGQFYLVPGTALLSSFAPTLTSFICLIEVGIRLPENVHPYCRALLPWLNGGLAYYSCYESRTISIFTSQPPSAPSSPDPKFASVWRLTAAPSITGATWRRIERLQVHCIEVAVRKSQTRWFDLPRMLHMYSSHDVSNTHGDHQF